MEYLCSPGFLSTIICINLENNSVICCRFSINSIDYIAEAKPIQGNNGGSSSYERLLSHKLHTLRHKLCVLMNIHNICLDATTTDLH